MKPKLTFLGISVVLALLIATLLPANPTLAAKPDRDAGQSQITILSEAKDQNRNSTIDEVWSSGWINLTPGDTTILIHNLGGDVEDYAIQMWFMDTDAGGYGIHNRAYGGLEDNGLYQGAIWRGLTANNIRVTRNLDDTLADGIRVWIWPSEPILQYCSTWTAIGQGDVVTVNHNLGGNVDDYVVGLWFRDPVAGIHQMYYGGVEDGGNLYGAYWQNLDASQVQVARYPDDPYAAEFRLCVSTTDPPDWDSGWVDISPDETKTLLHNLGGSVTRYIVRTEFKSLPNDGAPEAPMAIHQFAYGGDASNVLAKDVQYLGANWQNLTGASIDVYRWADDTYADQVRVRIWQRVVSVYLPIVVKNYL